MNFFETSDLDILLFRFFCILYPVLFGRLFIIERRTNRAIQRIKAVLQGLGGSEIEVKLIERPPRSLIFFEIEYYLHNESKYQSVAVLQRNLIGFPYGQLRWDYPIDRVRSIADEAEHGNNDLETKPFDLSHMADELADQMALIRKGGDWDGAFREIESFDGEKKDDEENGD